MSKYLLTGMGGFIGSALYDFLNKKGHEVVGIPHSSFNTINEDRMEKLNPDYIIHLSAYGNMSSQKDEFECIQANYLNTYKLLATTKNINYKSFVFVSTSSVYGNKGESMKEIDILSPNTFYSATKAGAEYLCRVFARQYDKSIVIARPFSVYGPGEANFRFIPTVCRSLIIGDKFGLYEKANHDWIYIDDVVNALYKISKSKNWSGQAINMGTGVQTTNVAVVKMLETIANKKANYTKIDNIRYNDSVDWFAHNFRLLSLGWKQKFSLYKGLKKTYHYEKSKNKKEDN